MAIFAIVANSNIYAVCATEQLARWLARDLGGAVWPAREVCMGNTVTLCESFGDLPYWIYSPPDGIPRLSAPRS